MTPEDIRTENALFYRDTLQAFTQASLAAWREAEAEAKARRDALAAHWLEAIWNKEDEQ